MNNSKNITSPLNKALGLTLFTAKQAFGSKHNVDIFEGMITFKEFHDHFVAEKNSNEINEQYKLQRDVSEKDSRVKGIIEYIKNGASIFPGVTVFVTKLTVKENYTIGNKEIVQAELAADTPRMAGDGQGRLTAINALMASLSEEEIVELSQYTLAAKIIVTHTQTLYEARHIIRTTFSDYHISLKKPSSSLSLYFSSDPYGRFMQDMLSVTVKGVPLIEWISLKGKITNKQAWTLAMFANFIQTALGKSKGTLNRELASDECYEQTSLLMKKVLAEVFDTLPLEVLLGDNVKTIKQAHDKALFTKALFLTGLGYMVRSLLEDAIINNALSFDVLKGLILLPLTDKTCPTLKEIGVIDEQNKIISKSDKIIAKYLCRKLRVVQCEAL
jgi:DGQHR domain-containing protein